MVEGSRLASLLPIAGCCLIGVIGLAIATVIICSLIPLYLNYRAVSRSSNSVKPYSLSNVDFARYYNGGKRSVRMLRSTTQSVVPTAATIQGFQDELDSLFASIGAKCNVKRLSMSSTSAVSLDLDVYFTKPPTVISYKSQLKLIKNVLLSGKTIQVPLEYYLSCYLNPINAGPTTFQSQANLGVFNNVPQPTEVPLASLEQAVDECQSVPKCVQISTQQLNYEILADTSQGYTYYCFYWTPTTYLNDININFTFENTANQIYLDDITFNSTTNLIEDGGFETNYIPAAWDCNGNCSNYIVEGYGHTGIYSFSSPGGNVPLQQTVTIPANDNTQTYQFGFWLAFNCNATNPCTVAVTATEEAAVTTQIPTQASTATTVALAA